MAWGTPIFERQPGLHFFPTRHDKTIESDSDKPLHQCTLCPYKSKWAHNMKRHIKIKHTQQQLKCPQCGAAYDSFEGLQQHLVSQHNMMPFLS